MVEHDLYNEMMQNHESCVPKVEPNSIGLLTEPTQCTLLSNIRGYQIEVAMGQVHPQQTVLHCVPVDEGFVVVFVDSVVAKFKEEKLERPINDEVTTVGEALLQRVQWRKGYVMVNNSPLEKVKPQKVQIPKPKPPSGSSKPPQNLHLAAQNFQLRLKIE